MVDLKFGNSFEELPVGEEGLHERVEVTCLSDIFESDWSALVALTLLGRVELNVRHAAAH